MLLQWQLVFDTHCKIICYCQGRASKSVNNWVIVATLHIEPKRTAHQAHAHSSSSGTLLLFQVYTCCPSQIPQEKRSSGEAMLVSTVAAANPGRPATRSQGTATTVTLLSMAKEAVVKKEVVVEPLRTLVLVHRRNEDLRG